MLFKMDQTCPKWIKLVQNGLKIFWNVLEYIWNIPENFGIFLNIFEYYRIFLNILNYLEDFVTFWSILKYSGLFWNIAENSLVFWNIVRQLRTERFFSLVEKAGAFSNKLDFIWIHEFLIWFLGLGLFNRFCSSPEFLMTL